MPNDPYIILGVSKDATQSEITEAYNLKRAEYKSHLFDAGESGANAARMIEQLDEAYSRVMENAQAGSVVSGEGDSVYEKVRGAIRNKDLETAQRELDNLTYRGAEWHYLQSVVFYQKNWFADSKSQLEIALQMDPMNAKYQDALNKIKKKIDGTHAFNKNDKHDTYQDNATATERSYAQENEAMTRGCCTACEALWCADCCCECMGGDLIRCC